MDKVEVADFANTISADPRVMDYELMEDLYEAATEWHIHYYCGSYITHDNGKALIFPSFDDGREYLSDLIRKWLAEEGYVEDTPEYEAAQNDWEGDYDCSPTTEWERTFQPEFECISEFLTKEKSID